MEGWYERVRSRLPEVPVVRELIEAVERLPGMKDWSPEHGLENRSMDLVAWGYVLWLTRSLAGVDALQRKLANEILTFGRPAPDTLAELSAAGLCIALGAVAGGRIPPRDGKTADWRMVWPGDAALDLEVTAASRKQRHVQRQELANELANALFRPERDFDLVVHLVDPTVAEDRDAVLTAAPRMASGMREGAPGRWELQAQGIAREPTVLIRGGPEPGPAWWPSGDARCFALRGQLAGPDARRAPPQVRVWFGVPYDSYVNPVMGKADFPQGEAGLPFLVAVDISSLPGAFREMPRALAGFLPLWKGVSGILLFHAIMGADRVGWLWRLLGNPDAAAPLPDVVRRECADLSETMETGLKLTNQSKDGGSRAVGGEGPP